MIVGPNIVRNGLILHIDAGSVRCHRNGDTFGYNLVSGQLLTGASGTPGTGTPTTSSDAWPINRPLFGGILEWSSSLFTQGINVNEDLGSNSAGTYCFWYKKDLSSTDYLADGRNDGGTYILTNYLEANINAGNSLKYKMETPYNASSTLFLDRWQHIAVTSDAGGSSIYIDGILYSESPIYNNTLSGSNSFSETFGKNYRIGTRYTTAAGWDGDMGALMFYNRVLTAEEVLQNYNATKRRYLDYQKDPLLEGMIAAYSFEDNNRLLDELGKHHGLNTSTVLTGSVDINSGNSLYYDIASDSDSAVSHSTDFDIDGTSAVTLMCDMYPTANGGSATSNVCALFEALGGNHIYHIGYDSSNRIRGRIYTTTNTDKITTATVPLNEWRRVMLRWTSGEPIRIQIEGEVEESGSDLTGTPTTRTLPFCISMPSFMTGYVNRQFAGRVDNVMVWKRKLSDAERDRLFDTKLTFKDLI
jgi:hypothetical protein